MYFHPWRDFLCKPPVDPPPAKPAPEKTCFGCIYLVRSPYFADYLNLWGCEKDTTSKGIALCKDERMSEDPCDCGPLGRFHSAKEPK